MASETTFLDIVEKFYAAALNDDQWSAALDDAGDLFGAIGVSFEIIDKKTSIPVFLDLGTRLDVSGVTEEYIQYYGAISPRVQRCVSLPTGSIMYDHAIISEAEMNRDEFYADLESENGLRYFVSGHVLQTPSHLAIIAAQRSPQQGHVGETELRTMQRLLPHVRQAMDTKFRLAAARRENQSVFDAFDSLEEGCILIDGAGKILHVNEQAARIVSANDGLDVADRCLAFSDHAASASYALALGTLELAEGDGQDLALRNFQARRPSGERSFIVHLRQLPIAHEINPYVSPASAAVFIRDPSRFLRLDDTLLQQSYGLTAAETDLAAHLDRGLSLREIARLRDVAITTVRSQLYALMGKLAVSKQTDLIRLLVQYRKPFN